LNTSNKEKRMVGTPGDCIYNTFPSLLTGIVTIYVIIVTSATATATASTVSVIITGVANGQQSIHPFRRSHRDHRQRRENKAKLLIGDEYEI
jgi:hypothetical protein